MKANTNYLLAITLLSAFVAACSENLGSQARVAPVEAPVLLEEQAATSGTGRVRAGVVTAADIDDQRNLAFFQRYQAGASRALTQPSLPLSAPVVLRVVDTRGAPAPGAQVYLHQPGTHDPFFSGVSGVDGQLTVFPQVLGVGALPEVEARVYAGDDVVTQRIQSGLRPSTLRVATAQAYVPEFLDLVFVIDVSGSMSDELAWLACEFENLVRQVRAIAPRTDARFGLVAYQSPGDPFVIRNFGLTKRPEIMTRWLESLSAQGGAGGEEVVGAALSTAMDLPWRRGYGERLVFVIGDEPPSRAGMHSALDATRQATQRNVQIFGLGASGAEDAFELLLRQAAVATGGRYLFLTDDSGIGDVHAEPSIPCYRVTRLKSLLTRVILSEVTGLRQEASQSDIIRTVGTYRAGVCKT